MGEDEDSTFYEARRRFREVREKLERGDKCLTPVRVTPIPPLDRVEIEPPKPLPPLDDPFEIINLLFNHIFVSLSTLSPFSSFLCEENKSLNKMDSVKNKLEVLLITVNSATNRLRETNDVVFSVFKKVDSVCKNIILNNSDLFEIVQQILLKFCEAGDFLDFEQTETTINTLFEMSKLIYIYKNKVDKLLEKSVELEDDYKIKKFPFYYIREEEDSVDSFYEPIEIKSKDELPYTEWTTWIETFNETIVGNEGEIMKEQPSQVGQEETIQVKDKLNERPIKDLPLPLTVQEMVEKLKLDTVKFSSLPKYVVKIGEATFSEVFRYKDSVYKIIPLGEGEGFTPFDVFVNEAYIHKTLSGEIGVCSIQNILIVKGKYPRGWLKAWDNYERKENERPCKYTKDQRYGVVVMDFGGLPLEKVVGRRTFNMVYFIKTLCRSLFHLENKYGFEHRDLHWGNILVRNNKFNLIDFALSRLVNNNRLIYNDLNKYKWLFEGDSTVDEQFEIYRKMKGLCEGDWRGFNSQSNFYWVVYLTEKIYNKILLDRPPTNKEQSLIKVIKRCKDLNEFNDYVLKYSI